jgi:hypothetical protein
LEEEEITKPALDPNSGCNLPVNLSVIIQLDL